MRRKLFNILAVMCIAVVLALLGLLGAMLSTGQLSHKNIALIAKVLRGEPLTKKPAKVVPPATTQPAATAQEQISQNQATTDLMDRQIDLRLRELHYQMTQLKNLEAQIELDRQRLAKARTKFYAQVQASQKLAQDQGFQKELSLLGSIQPDQAKQLLMNEDPKVAAQYLAQLDSRKRAQIVDAFRSPAEMARLQQLLTIMQNPQ